MDVNYYNEFAASLKKKDRLKAKKYLDKFINSFDNFDDKKLWAFEHLAELEKKGVPHIRHELFIEIIFPVLLDGYNNKDINSMIWIIKFIYNFKRHTNEWKKIYKDDERDLLKRCYEIDPNNEELIKMYTQFMIEQINGTIKGINYSMESIERQYKTFAEETQFLNKLDKNNQYNESIAKRLHKIEELIKIIKEIDQIENI